MHMADLDAEKSAKQIKNVSEKQIPTVLESPLFRAVVPDLFNPPIALPTPKGSKGTSMQNVSYFFIHDQKKKTSGRALAPCRPRKRKDPPPPPLYAR